MARIEDDLDNVFGGARPTGPLTDTDKAVLSAISAVRFLGVATTLTELADAFNLPMVSRGAIRPRVGSQRFRAIQEAEKLADIGVKAREEIAGDDTGTFGGAADDDEGVFGPGGKLSPESLVKSAILGGVNRLLGPFAPAATFGRVAVEQVLSGDERPAPDVPMPDDFSGGAPPPALPGQLGNANPGAASAADRLRAQDAVPTRGGSGSDLLGTAGEGPGNTTAGQAGANEAGAQSLGGSGRGGINRETGGMVDESLVPGQRRAPVPATLHENEMVLRSGVVEVHGPDALEALNAEPEKFEIRRIGQDQVSGQAGDDDLGFDAFPVVNESAIPSGRSGGGFEAFPRVDSTPDQKIRAFGEQATGSAIQTGSTVGGMVMGAKIGFLGGPFSPVTVPLGAAVGAGAGFIAGGEVKSILGIPDLEELPEDQRPFAVGGEVVGGGVPFASFPLIAGRTGARLPPSLVGNYINKVIDTAARMPGAFSAAEAGALGGAAVAGGTAEAFLPGNRGARFGAEVAGGLLNPTRLIVGSGKLAWDGARKALEAMSPAARQTQAARILQGLVREAGEDPELLAKLLREPGISGLTETSAQKTGSPALAAMEAKLAQSSEKFGAEVRKRAEDSLNALKTMIVALRGTGDPAALTAAAELQQVRFRTLMTARLQLAEQEVAEAAAKISQDTPAARSELSAVAHRVIGEALEDARTVERELWGQVSRDLPATAENVVSRFDGIRDELLPEEALPQVIEGFAERVRDGTTTSGELTRFRSRMLSLAREAQGQGRSNDARILGEMAEAALADLDAMFNGPNSGVLRTFGETAENYNAARQFSRELHDTFTRTFAGRAAARGRGGELRIPPELMLSRALGTGKQAGELRFSELEEATRFLITKGRPSPRSVENVETMLDAQERLIRLAASEAINPTTGRINPNRLSKILRDNEALFNRFPEAKADLSEAVQSELKLKDLERMTTDASRIVDRQAMFSKLAGFENASDAVRRAVATGNKTPLKDLEAMAKVAKRGGREAEEGLKAAIWEHAARNATTSQGFSWQKLRSALFDPVRPDQPSLIEFMESKGLMSAEDVKQAEVLLAEADKISTALTTRSGLDELLAAPDALFDLLVRVAGARTGSMLSGGGPAGSPLIAAGRGSETFRRLFEKIPQGRVKDILIEAAINPDFAALLLEKPVSERDTLTLARQIHAYLLQAGFTAATDDRVPESTSPSEMEAVPESPLELEGSAGEADLAGTAATDLVGTRGVAADDPEEIRAAGIGKQIFKLIRRLATRRREKEPAEPLSTDQSVALGRAIAELARARFEESGQTRITIEPSEIEGATPEQAIEALTHAARGDELPTDDKHITELNLGEVINSSEIAEATGLNVDGYSRSIDTAQISHAFRDHGPGTEDAPDQEPISAEAVSAYLDVVENPDRIIPRIRSKPKANRIRYEKRVNGHIVVVEEVRTGKRRLAFFTMWIKKAK